ncbi:MAG TPA: DUF2817 domain-containing protein [Chloroflexi bacterium]|nr:DUF2817 domain-containing protein [Chloroflexota bacterium]
MTNSTLLPPTYEASRDRFRRQIDRVRLFWPHAQPDHHPVGGDEDLTIDWIETPTGSRDRLLILTTGEHGIEGYVGSAVLQLFIDEFLPHLDPQTTGLLLIHAINPWGMKHRRRTNAANVDLNRNFLIASPTPYDTVANPDYGRLHAFLNPQGAVRRSPWRDLGFLLQLARHLVLTGPSRIRRATLLGQYRFPQSIYYGGPALQEETQVLINLYQQRIEAYPRVLLMDMHTGYGPRYQMSLVNSPLEPTPSEELARRFAYPLVVKADPSEFYSMQGDMLDFVYTLIQKEYPDRHLYATSFEFGTLGDSLPATLRSLRTMIAENQLYWHGAQTQRVREDVARDFEDLFVPSEERWRVKALADARQAITGILRAERFI